MKRRNKPEEILQRQVADYLDRLLPDDALWWHTPNGGGRTKAEAGALKAQGVKPGVSDVLIMYRGYLWGIELKAPGKYPTQAQRDWRDAMLAQGFQWDCCRSLDEVEATLLGWAFPMQGRLA